MALRNLYGHVIWGNSLGIEQRLVYRTGFNLRGFVREVPLGDCPEPVQKIVAEPTLSSDSPTTPTPPDETPDEPMRRTHQLRLF